MNALVVVLGDLLMQPLSSVEILPGGRETWTEQTTDEFPFLLLENNLGVPQKILYALYMQALPQLQGDNALQASAVVLLANPAHQTALNTRKRLVLAGSLSVGAELSFSERLMPSSKPAAKESIAWAHRRWLLGHRFASTIPPDTIGAEFSLVLKCCQLYPRNYYAWSHHYFLVDHVCSLLQDSSDLGSPYVSVLLLQAQKLESWMEMNVSDFSSMDQYCRLVARVQSLSIVLEQLSQPAYLVQHGADLIKAFPEHESLWQYLRGLINVYPELLPLAVSLLEGTEGVWKERFVQWVGRRSSL